MFHDGGKDTTLKSIILFKRIDINVGAKGRKSSDILRDNTVRSRTLVLYILVYLKHFYRLAVP